MDQAHKQPDDRKSRILFALLLALTIVSSRLNGVKGQSFAQQTGTVRIVFPGGDDAATTGQWRKP